MLSHGAESPRAFNNVQSAAYTPLTEDESSPSQGLTPVAAAGIPRTNPVTGKPTLPRAQKACARCRKQKLRCDSFRPCALCVRSCVECVNQAPENPQIQEKKRPVPKIEQSQQDPQHYSSPQVQLQQHPPQNDAFAIPASISVPHQSHAPARQPHSTSPFQEYYTNDSNAIPPQYPRYAGDPRLSVSEQGEPVAKRRRVQPSYPPYATSRSSDHETYNGADQAFPTPAHTGTNPSPAATFMSGPNDPMAARQDFNSEGGARGTLRRHSSISSPGARTTTSQKYPSPAQQILDDGRESQEKLGPLRSALRSKAQSSSHGSESSASPRGMRTIWGGSSALGGAREVFEMHSTIPRVSSRTYSIPGGESRPKPRNQKAYTGRHLLGEASDASGRQAVMSQLMLLPSKALTNFLIQQFMESVHWFMYVIYEKTFMRRYEELMQLREEVLKEKERIISSETGEIPPGQSSANLRRLSDEVETDENLTFSILILTVCCIGGRYAAQKPHLQDTIQSLASKGATTRTTKLEPIITRLLARIKLHILDIVSIGDLSSVTTCVLIGSFYLYHGEPNLAWSVLGCGIKVAHTLALHRELQPNPPAGFTEEGWILETQMRKRLWWALHVFDRFAAMVYGRPMGINDDDCDVGLAYNIDESLIPIEKLDFHPSNRDSGTGADDSSPRSRMQETKEPPLFTKQQLTSLAPGDFEAASKYDFGVPTLMTYQHRKMGVYYLTGEAIRLLYRLNGRMSPYQRNDPTKANDPARVADLVASVETLDHKLKLWYATVPDILKLPERVSASTIGADEKTCRIYQMQAFALQLAYDATCVLVHRPMLGYQVSQSKLKSPPTCEAATFAEDPFRYSANACFQAALRTSKIALNTELFEAVQNTHAVSFLGIHLFNVGVVLCITAISEPVSLRAHEAKLAIGRIIGMQNGLINRTAIASQGSQILKDLVRLILNREMERLFVSGPGDKQPQQPSSHEDSEEEVEAHDEGNGEYNAPATPTKRPFGNCRDISMPMQTPAWSDGDMGLNPPARPQGFQPFNVVENLAVNQTLIDLERVMDDSQFDWLSNMQGEGIYTDPQSDAPPGTDSSSWFDSNNNNNNGHWEMGTGSGGAPAPNSIPNVQTQNFVSNPDVMKQTWLWGTHRTG